MVTRLKPHEVTLDREVVLSQVTEAPIYRIREVIEGEVRLALTEKGQEVNAGYHNSKLLFHPNQKQRAYAAKQA